MKKKGFTLLELMVVVAIIGILVTIALPSYKSHLINAKIPDAFNGLNDLAMKAQQYYMNNKNYNDASGVFNCQTSQSTANFTFSCNTLPANATGMTVQSIVMTATGKGDLNGFIYTVNESGVKTTVQPGGVSSNYCWIKTKGGAC